MTLDEIRIKIDKIDTQMKELFLEGMECAKGVANVKKETGGDVFVLERELSMIDRTSKDLDLQVKEEYIMFLRHLMSLSRHLQYGILSKMQENVLNSLLNNDNIKDKKISSKKVEISFICDEKNSDLNLYINMIKLNKIDIEKMDLTVKNGVQNINITLVGDISSHNMRILLCQLGKEAKELKILKLA